MEARLTRGKLLGEFLLEQQEPFALEAFLLERGCSRSLLNGSFANRSTSWKRRKGVVRLSKLLRAIHHQIGFLNGRSSVRAKHGGGKCSSSDRFSTSSISHSQGVAEEDGLSSPSSTTVYISCNESSDTEESSDSQKQDGLETDTRDKIQENEHHSSPPHNQQEPPLPSCKAGSPVKSPEDSTVSAPLPEILLQCLNQQVGWREYSNSKKGARQTSRLLFDCVMEAIESQERKEGAKGRDERAASGDEEEMGKAIWERVMEWGTKSRSGTSITEVVHEHLLDREEEGWGDCITQKMEISTGIADGILGDIRDEILADMKHERLSLY